MKDNKINRRDFIKVVGISTLATTATMYGCKSDSAQGNDTPISSEVPKDKMTYRQVGEIKDTISLLGYGCMRWPLLPTPVKGESVIDQEATNKLVDYAIEHGVNYFDTAPMYIQGWSEPATGAALKRHPRDKFFITTKMSNFKDHSLEFGIAMYNNSFKNLQVDYIDYYLLHVLGGSSGTIQDRFLNNGLLDFLLEQRRIGKIRHLGWSFHGTKEGFDEALALHDTVKWDFIQVQLNYSDWKYATGPNVNADYLYSEITKRDIPIIVMEPLLGGRLAKLPDNIYNRLKERADDESVASWAFKFAGTPKNVITVLSGMTYLEHLQDNIRTYSPLVPLTEEENTFLLDTAKMMREYPTIPCNECQYCMPCPYGIDIPSILSHYNKCINGAEVPMSQLDENYAKARQAFLVGYDRSVPRLRQASHCIGCNQCVSHCPQGIDIPTELHKIDDYVEKLKQGTL